MNLKTACKTAMILIIISFAFSLLREFLNILTIFTPVTTERNDSLGQYVPILWLVLQSFLSLIAPALTLVGLIALLTGQIKRLNDPQNNIKTPFVIASIFYVLVTGAAIGYTAQLLWLSFRYHSDLFSSEFGLDMCLYITMIACSLSMCIFSIKQIHRSVSRASGITALVCQWLWVVAFTVYIGNSFYTHFRGEYRNYFDLNERYSCLWLTTSAITYIAGLLSTAAVIVFLTAWIKHRPLPPEAGVIESSPEPLPTLSAAQELPGQE